MPCLRWFVRCSLAALALCASLQAEPLLLPERLELDSFAAFRPPPPNWRIAGGLAGDPRRERTLQPTPGTGLLIALPEPGKNDILTAWEHGDIDLELEFLMPQRSNSGVYLQGRYEVQLYDSWQVEKPGYIDSGSIYERYDESRPEGQRGYEGHPPAANAARAPGLWQRLRIEFEAPRFDSQGRKTRNARFRRVELNGFVVHENVEVTGPTRAPTYHDEQPTGPLMLQGDHGPIAFRSIRYKRYAVERIGVEDVRYRLYPGEFTRIGEYDTQEPKRQGVPEAFSAAAVEKSGKFALVFTGSLVVPRDGRYAFKVPFKWLSGSTVQLAIDDQIVVVPTERGSHPGSIVLSKGRHPFRFDLIQTGPLGPAMELIAAGPGIPEHTLTAIEERGGSAPEDRTLPIRVGDEVVVQRSFVPFEPRKRLYGINVGTPSGRHFAYDFETGALLRVWRGEFLDARMMWKGRGNGQLGLPAGPALTLSGLPLLTLIEHGQNDRWPHEPEALWSSQGYKLGLDGLPVFLASLADLSVRDHIAPAKGEPGLTRTLTVSGRFSTWSTWVLLAEAGEISPQPDGSGWIIGDREWYLDWPANAAVTPVVRREGDRQLLAVPLTRAALDQPITYTLVW